jgi:hypothetical protein
MKTDLYTKTMLTLIVLFLGILSFDKVYDSVIQKAEGANNKWTCSYKKQTSVEGYINEGSFEKFEIIMVESPFVQGGKTLMVCGK